MNVLLLVAVITAMIIKHSAKGSEFPGLEADKIRIYLERLNKPAVKSINSPDGDIIDCVLMADQPAFDHPLLKNHTIQMKPSFHPEGVNEPKAKIQLWHMNGKCSENTIPIRRTTKEDLLRANSIENYGIKTHKNIPKPQSSNGFTNHEYAIARDPNGKFFGTKATINIWNPNVQTPNEFSLAQIWLATGGYQNSDLNSIEAGWQVFNQLYGDNNARFFIYWTRDAYRSGCYNLLCSGFVQTNNEIVIGGSFASPSSYDGSQYSVTILVWKDPGTGNWWLQMDGKNVGYWPVSIFTNLADGADRVDWGGEIVNLGTNGQHTTTQMGSGHFAEEGFGRAGYFKNIQVIDGSNNLRDPDPQGLVQIVSNQYCYNHKLGSVGSSWGTYFYFGGPGRNSNCP
ncbi:PREDICTED: uncharacterized protein LOC104801736 [Tarenaya hassleriana]|uniref:uncharacterized protein LOC104801736 n=1 Tax=Tarenaya hassleriana TaxID=28532 RepID=UPI00053C3881|nr:PREDICTED: uncharacterized protein LOC104801736 [Tarenaya hassleriana]